MVQEHMVEGTPGPKPESGSLIGSVATLTRPEQKAPKRPWHIEPEYDSKRAGEYKWQVDEKEGDEYSVAIDPKTGKEVARVLRIAGEGLFGRGKQSDADKQNQQGGTDSSITPSESVVPGLTPQGEDVQDINAKARVEWEGGRFLSPADVPGGPEGQNNQPQNPAGPNPIESAGAPLRESVLGEGGNAENGGNGNGNNREVAGVPENPNLPDKEKRPSIEFVVAEIRRLEAMPTEERYSPCTEEEPYPNLKKLEFRYKQFEEYVSIMEVPGMARLQKKLKDCKALEEGFIGGAKTTEDVLELFDENGNEDPGLKSLDKQVELLKQIKNPTNGQKIALLVAEERLKNGRDLEYDQGGIAKLRFKTQRLEHDLDGLSKQGIEQRVAELRGKDSLTPIEEAELDLDQDRLAWFIELAEERARLQAYETYHNTPNILVAKIRSLRANPTSPELCQALIEFLADERNRLETEIGLIQAIAIEKQIADELRQPGQVDVEDWEKEMQESAKRKEEEAERIESFDSLPPFVKVLEAYKQAKIAEKHDPAATVVRQQAEKRLERYLYHAAELEITDSVTQAFDRLYVDFTIPEIGYYGDVRRVSKDDIERTMNRFKTDGIDEDLFEMYDWDFERYGGRVDPDRNTITSSGIIGWIVSRAGLRMRDILERAENSKKREGYLSLLSGEWDPDVAKRKTETILAKRMYWEKSVTGYYQFKIDSEVDKNPYAEEQLRMAADQWIAYMQSGVIRRNPQEQLRELQQFMGQYAPLAEKIFRQLYPEDAKTLLMHSENKGRASREIKALRQELKFRAEAPVAAYANDTDESEAFGSVLADMSDDIEGPEVYREGYGALNGMVALAADVLENEPEWSRVYFHPEGSRGYLSANNAAQRLLRKVALKQLADKLATRSLSDKLMDTDQISSDINNEAERVKSEIAAIGDESVGNNRTLKERLEHRLGALQERQKNLLSISRSNDLNTKIELLKVVTGKDAITSNQRTEWQKELNKSKKELRRVEETPEAAIKIINDKIALLEGALGINNITPEQKKGWEKELIKKTDERIALSKVIRREKLGRIGLDQSREDFQALYGDLEEQDDFKLLPEPEKIRLRKQKELEAEAAVSSAIDFLNITGQLSARGGPVVKIRNPELLAAQTRVENIKQQMIDLADFIKARKDRDSLEKVEWEGRDKSKDAIMLARTELVKPIFAKYQPNMEQTQYTTESARAIMKLLATELKVSRKEAKMKQKQLQESNNPLDKKEDRVAVRSGVRFSQYAVYRAEQAWTQIADWIMKNLSEEKQDQAVQDLTDKLIPDQWNLKKSNDGNGNNNLFDVLEGVSRQAMDDVFKDGLRAVMRVPHITITHDGQINVAWVEMKGQNDQRYYLEDVDKLPESNGMLMAYLGTEEIMTNAFSLPYRVAEAKAGKGGFLGRALRMLDPAFNRLSREDDPNYLRNFQDLQRAIHAGVEAQWQRHFQIKTEFYERTIIGADIRKNKTGNKKDRYKIVDGNPRNNLLEHGREEHYVTSRIINHASEVLTHADRRTRRGADLAPYGPMQHESDSDESGVEDTREFMGLIDTMSKVQAQREGGRLDFLYLKLKGERWKMGAKLRVALESGPAGDKQWTGLYEKNYSSADRARKFRDGVQKEERALQINIEKEKGEQAIIAREQLALLNIFHDFNLEDYISLFESIDERLSETTKSLYPDLSYLRLAQASLWKDGVPSFLADGTLNFQRDERGRDTLTEGDNGTSRHTSTIWVLRNYAWRLDPRKGGHWYPGAFNDVQGMAKERMIYEVAQRGIDVIIGRIAR